ncbi:MAG: tetratricopeptide repeat protein, partial [Gluconacetobacter diazotrophicus]|nr:tetratricopeptide repeat protein [Gluconacetobacter diazotrophicus]
MAPSRRAEPPGIAAERHAAVAAFASGDFDAAARQLVPLLTRVPPDPDLLRACGIALTRSGEPSRGLPYLARARRSAPDDAGAALWLGLALQQVERFGDSVAAFRDAARLAPADPGIPIHLSRSLLRLDRPDEALCAARDALARAPELPEALHAVHLAERSVLLANGTSGETLVTVLSALGEASLRLGLVPAAHDTFAEAVGLDPRATRPAVGLALVEHLVGRPLTAIARLRTLLAADPTHPGI